jgi:hypothetical protein
MLLTLHSLSQFVTSFVLVEMKSSEHPVFLLGLSEGSDELQWPIGRKTFQKLVISISQQIEKQ